MPIQSVQQTSSAPVFIKTSNNGRQNKTSQFVNADLIKRININNDRTSTIFYDYSTENGSKKSASAEVSNYELKNKLGLDVFA